MQRLVQNPQNPMNHRHNRMQPYRRGPVPAPGQPHIQQEEEEEEKKKRMTKKRVDPTEWPIIPGYPLPKCHIPLTHIVNQWNPKATHRAELEMLRYRDSRRALLESWGCLSFDEFNRFAIIRPKDPPPSIAPPGAFIDVFGLPCFFFSLFVFLEADEMFLFVSTCKVLAFLPYGLDPVQTNIVKHFWEVRMTFMSTNQHFQTAWWQRIEIYFYHLPELKRDDTISFSYRLKKAMKKEARKLVYKRTERMCPICHIRSNRNLRPHPILKTVILCQLCLKDEPAYQILDVPNDIVFCGLLVDNPLLKSLRQMPILPYYEGHSQWLPIGRISVTGYIKQQVIDAGFDISANALLQAEEKKEEDMEVEDSE